MMPKENAALKHKQQQMGLTIYTCTSKKNCNVLKRKTH
jgi:hypothetical protein